VANEKQCPRRNDGSGRHGDAERRLVGERFVGRAPSLSFFGLTQAQERTWDAFRSCAPNGAFFDRLRVKGSFTFQLTLQSDVHTIKRCMTQMGSTGVATTVWVVRLV
jgi:hypothetical protein